MTFFQYVTRPSGVGRTKWLPFIAIRIGCGLAIYNGIDMLANNEPWGWLVLAFGPGLLIGFYLGTRSNYRTDKAREERGPNNKHRTDVCETCNPVRWNDGRPLTYMYQWYAAVNHISWESAQMDLELVTADALASIRKSHDKYLNHPQFDKFRS